jgi:hypothetical protein
VLLPDRDDHDDAPGLADAMWSVCVHADDLLSICFVHAVMMPANAAVDAVVGAAWQHGLVKLVVHPMMLLLG